MATKEVMVSAPLIVLLYDRTFVAGTFHEAWQRRGRWYLGLFGTWLLLGYLVVHTGGTRGGAVGFGLDGITARTYVLTQCRAIVLYLKLTLWPYPLVVDYGTAVVRHAVTVIPQALVLMFLVGTTIFMLRHRPVLGFVGTWFFLILAPSSSVLPLATQTIAEHRMYLPLAAVIAFSVLGLYAWIGRRSLILFAAIAVGLGCLTIHRNKDYYTEVSIGRDTITKCPGNERAHLNLGRALSKIPGRMPDAIAEYQAALVIKPDYAEAHSNLGNALSPIPGRLPDAIAEFQAALRIKPDLSEAHDGLGYALSQIPGRLPDAIAEFQTALRINPDSAEAHSNLGNALSQIPGRLPEAIAECQTALRIKPDYAEAHTGLGNALSQFPERLLDAVPEYEAALRIKPDYAAAHYDLGLTLSRIPGRLPEAISEYEAALRIQPDYPEAHLYLGNALSQIPGRLQDAITQYEEALRINPEFAAAHFNLGFILMNIPDRHQEAIVHFEAALRIRPDLMQAQEMLNRLQANQP
jgi:tetratricopeptide (TPR) repeat protein